MKERENKTIVRRYFEEVWNKGNLDSAEELVDRDFSVQGCGGAISGLEAVKLYVSSFRAICPHLHFTLLSMEDEGDHVVACWAGRGMHPVLLDCQDGGQPAPKCAATGLSVYRIANGKIAEAWAGSDHLGTRAGGRLGISRDLS